MNLKEALNNELWKEHKLGDIYEMDGKPKEWTIAYYPLFGTWNNVEGLVDIQGGKKMLVTLEERWEDFEEPRALIECPIMETRGILTVQVGFDLREVPLRYLKKQKKK